MNDLNSFADELQFIELARHEAMQQGLPALYRVFAAAEGDSGQARILRRLLIGVYNGDEHPFDLNSLRGLDERLFDDAINVIRFDRHALKELRLYLPISAQKKVAQWAFCQRTAP